MNYNKIYQSLVERGKNRSLGEAYKETHHIIPKCMNGSNDKDNLVDLTPEEHYLAHLLLVKIHPKHFGLIRAAMIMSQKGNHQQNRINNKQYGWLRRATKDIDSRIEHTCKLCNKLFMAYPSANRVYCSKACRAKLGQLRPVQVEKIKIKCQECNKEFEAYSCSKRKFCSKQCKNDSLKRKVTLCCIGCKKDFEVTPYTAKLRKRKYCSPKCARLRYFSKNSLPRI